MSLPFSVTVLHLPTNTMDTRLWFWKNTYQKQYTEFTHSCTDTFSWAKWEISHFWGKTGFTFSPMFSITLFLSNLLLIPLRLSGFLVYRSTQIEGAASTLFLGHKNSSGVPSLFISFHSSSSSPSTASTRQPETTVKSTVLSLKYCHNVLMLILLQLTFL